MLNIYSYINKLMNENPEIEPKKLLALKERIKEKGFDLNYLVLTQN